jgi:hypothetical protein
MRMIMTPRPERAGTVPRIATTKYSARQNRIGMSHRSLTRRTDIRRRSTSLDIMFVIFPWL